MKEFAKMLGLPLNHIDDEAWETFEKAQEVMDKVEEFWKLVEKFNEEKVKVWTSDGTEEWQEFPTEDNMIPIYGSFDYDYCSMSPSEKHVWVLDNSTTSTNTYRCVHCGIWKAETWNYGANIDYSYSTHLLGC